MIRRATERDRYVGGLETWKQLVEPDGVLGCEPASQEIVRAVEVVQLGLQTHHVGSRAAERAGGFPKLISLGAVLGVVDDEKLTFGPNETLVAGTGLSPRTHIGHDDHFDVRRELHRRGGFTRLDIVFLDEQLHVEAVRGIVECSDAVDELSEHLGFAVHGQQDRVHRLEQRPDRRLSAPAR